MVKGTSRKRAAAPTSATKTAAAAKRAKAAAAKSAPSPSTEIRGATLAQAVAELWGTPEMVTGGVMRPEGFAAFCSRAGVEDGTMESCLLMFQLMPEVDDISVVCTSRVAFQRAIENLACQRLEEVSGALTRLHESLRRSCYDPERFTPFFRWLFEYSKAIAAMSSLTPGCVRTVPLEEVGLPLLEVALGDWSLFPQIKRFCIERYKKPFTRDLWLQIGRLAHLTCLGKISQDLSNYDDADTGGGDAWPCMIDDFVEWHRGDADIAEAP